MGKGLKWLSAAVFSVIGLEAAADGASFVADTVETYPDQGTVQGRMYVSDQGMRMERTQRGEQVVQISLPNQGIIRILFPRQRTYMETRVPAGAGGPGIKPDNPCSGAPAAKCRKLGAEELSGIKTEKWELMPDKAPGPVLIWWDTARGISLRQEFHDGSMSQMVYKGQADYEGRKVERWEMVRVTAKGEEQRAEQLMDRELGIAVRERFPTGALRELRNIRVTKPDPSWYAVPQGFRLQQPRQQPGQQPGQQPQGGQGYRR